MSETMRMETMQREMLWVCSTGNAEVSADIPAATLTATVKI
jgi:hypothetical protein